MASMANSQVEGVTDEFISAELNTLAVGEPVNVETQSRDEIF